MSVAVTDATEPLRRIFLGPSLAGLATLIEAQGQQVLQRAGVDFPIRSAAIALLLAKQGPLAAADIAKTLDQSHQLVAQRLEPLLALRIVARVADPADARRRLLTITTAGRDQLTRLEICLEQIEAAYGRLFDELGCDLAARVVEVADALARAPLAERIPSRTPAQEPSR